MFRNWVFIAVFCLLLLDVSHNASAQMEPFTWEPYDFTITPPDEWQVQTSADELRLFEGEGNGVMGIGADTPTENGPVISVQVITPRSVPMDMQVDVLAQFAPLRRMNSTDGEYDDKTWPTIAAAMILGGRQIGMALVAETFIVTWSAPIDDWEALQPLFIAAIASIEATPATYSTEELLTQRLRWRGLSFAAPADWLLAYAGQGNHILVTSQESRQYFGATFTYGPLILDILDLSVIRQHLTPASLADVDLFVAQPGTIDPATITTEVNEDRLIATALLDSSGKALLIIAPNAAFVVAGIAGEDEWQATERALFEAILDTLSID